MNTKDVLLIRLALGLYRRGTVLGRQDCPQQVTANVPCLSHTGRLVQTILTVFLDASGIYRCGPASVTAVKEGDVDLKHDVPFVFAEVNADRVAWTYDSATRNKKPLHTDTRSIGQSISTKAVGSYARVDVTNTYKYEEGKEKSCFWLVTF